MADTPGRIRGGGSLATNGADIFALRGGGNTDIWRFDVSEDTWNSMADAPNGVTPAAPWFIEVLAEHHDPLPQEAAEEVKIIPGSEIVTVSI